VGSLYFAYFAVTVVLVLTPGATTAVVVKNTLARGHRAGMLAAAGAAVANATHATLAGLGLWVALGRWPVVLDALRAGGAAYLGWLGLMSLARALPRRPAAVRPAETGTSARSGAVHAARSSAVEGLAINILNPAIISFYLAVVPTFMPIDPPAHHFTMLATTHVVLAFACHAGWATAFHVLRRVFAHPGVRVGLELATGAAMLWLAARVLGRL
jgi:threonine/homoserine/homoserine lactone efflux protein